jgi:hypothetical protein
MKTSKEILIELKRRLKNIEKHISNPKLSRDSWDNAMTERDILEDIINFIEEKE